jgi:hypothetical protein
LSIQPLQYPNIREKCLTDILPGDSLLKSIKTKINVAGMTSFLLVAASLLGFNSMMPIAAAASPSINETTAEDNDGGGDVTTATGNMSLNANATGHSSTIELAEEPLAEGHYRIVSENSTGERQAQFSVEGNTTIVVPNATEMITTRDTGEGTFSFLPGGSGGSPSGQLHMTTEDGSESVIVNFTEFIRFDSSRGIGIAYFSTNSTGMLAPLNNITAVFLDEVQPNEDSIVRFFEWKNGGEPAAINDNNSTMINNGRNVTTAATTTTTTTTAATEAGGRGGREQQQCQLGIMMNEETFEVGEPVTINVTNGGDEALEFSNSMLGLEIENRDTGETYSLFSAQVITTLEPGESRTFDFTYEELVSEIGTGTIEARVGGDGCSASTAFTLA